MTNEVFQVELEPDPERTVEGLRDTGYDFNTALADLVDNSIAAGAENIWITCALDMSSEFVLAVLDDGQGMDREGLLNAMRYGSKRRDNPASLGKFGMGLKTASTAFCRRLEVTSRSDDESEFLTATWDLDTIASEGKWILELRSAPAEAIQLLSDLEDSPGTLVRWDRIDRLDVNNKYKAMDGHHRRKAVDLLASNLSGHLEMVFQRFIDGTHGARKVSIFVNDVQLAGWDPFCLDVISGPITPAQVPSVEIGENEFASFSVSSYVLPRKEEFDDTNRAKRARIGNDMQGVYVYRENRLIHGPDWLGMFKNEPHYSLARIDLSFDHTLDEAFQVDIKKSRILLNAAIHDYLQNKVFGLARNLADERYRKGTAAGAATAGKSLHANSNRNIGSSVPGLDTPSVLSVDESDGSATISTNYGEQRSPMKIVDASNETELYVTTVESLESSVLWQGGIVNGKQAVLLNAGHPYYQRGYLPHSDDTTVIQSLDYLIWALAQAELNNSNPENKEAFEEFRIEVSRNLKKLVSNLPEPKTQE
jgi:hypothetical protein